MAYDKVGALELRKANRDAHVTYLKSGDTVQQAGPFLSETGDMCGSLIILDVADLDAAKKWAAEDPYAKAGLFREVTLMPWNKVIG
jgi:uncharacterized protein YciI